MLVATPVFVSVCAVSAFAQDSPKAGIVMGVPAAFSVIWNVSDRVALRPEINFGHASSSVGGTESDQTTLNPGISAIFYTRTWDAVRAYVSPRYVYRRATSSISSPVGSSESTGSAHSIAGSAGAEFAAHRRFGVFGEVGIDYTRGTSDSGGISPKPTSDAWSMRTAVGAIFYF